MIRRGHRLSDCHAGQGWRVECGLLEARELGVSPRSGHDLGLFIPVSMVSNGNAGMGDVQPHVSDLVMRLVSRDDDGWWRRVSDAQR